MKRFIQSILLVFLCTVASAQLSPSGGEIAVNATTIENQQNPDIAINKNGEKVIVWESFEQDGSGYGVYVKMLDANNAEILSERIVNTTTTNDQRHPKVAIFPDGSFVVTWMSYNGSNWDVYASRFAKNGNRTMNEIRLTDNGSGEQKFPAISSKEDGRFIIVWEETDSIHGREGFENSLNGTEDFQINAATTTVPTLKPDVSFGTKNDSTYYVVWQEEVNANDYDIKGAVYTFPKTIRGSERVLNDNTFSQQTTPSVSVGGAENVRVTWEGYNSGTNAEDIYERNFNSFFNSSGGSENLTNTFRTGAQKNPDILVDSTGNYLISWDSFGQDSSFEGVYGQLYNSDRDKVGSEIKLNSTTSLYQQFSAIGWQGTTDKIMVVWQSGTNNATSTQDGNGYGIIAQSFTTSIPEINVKGNNVSIVSGSTTTSLADSTDLGNVEVTAGSNTNTFTIENTGSSDLTIPASGITISGTNAADFTVGGITLPATITAGNSATFTVTFDPSNTGAKTAIVNIANNDADENPYNFAISGGGTDICTPVTNTGQLLTWTGAKSTAWNDACNWSPTGIPAATNDVTIPSVPANQPTLSVNTAVAQSVEVQSGATLTIAAAGQLSINGFKSFTVGPSTDYAGFLNSGTVDNNGKLILGNTATLSTYGLWNVNIFNNNTGSEITIDRTTYSGLLNRSGTFTNAAKIIIGANASVGTYGLENQATFNNNTGGEIFIDRNTNTGLLNQSGAFTNVGKITAGANASVGFIGVRNDATFNNNTGGEINIDRSTNRGLHNLSGTFTNNSKITVGANNGVGLYGVFNIGTFNNNTTGEISIDRSTTVGLVNFIDANTFTNAGKVIIGANANVGNNAIENYEPFVNSNCGIIVAKRGSIDIASNGTYTNNGFTFVAGELINSGAFTNDGVLKYGNTSGNAIANATNPSAIVNDAPTPIFTYGGSFNGTINGIFTDTTLTASAGTFVAPNTFTPSGSLPAGNQTLYTSITQNNCANAVSVPFTFNYIPPTPEINLKGNSLSIIDGDTSPSAADSTDFGSVNNFAGSNANTFTIENTGTAGLTIPASGITVTGTDAADFTVSGITLPATILTSGSTTFTVTFDPSTVGVKAATLNISNNDSDENPYDFAIQGTATNICPTVATATELLTWTGAKSTAWEDACNWSPTGIPAATNDVTIPSAPANQPTLSVNTAVAKSVEVQSGATLTIAAAGQLSINGFKAFGVFSKTTAFVNDGTVQNSGKMVLGNVNSVGEYGIWNRGSFSNNTTAEIEVNRSTVYGIRNDISYTFNNASKITIGSLATVGSFGLLNEGVFGNNTGGEINIDNSSLGGILNNNNAIFTNVAAISIGANAASGNNGVSNRGTFNNTIGGVINIDNSSTGGLNNTGTFNNLAKLYIGINAGVGSQGIYNSSNFNNNGAGEIKIDGASGFGIINVFSGNIVNESIITIGENTSTLTTGVQNRSTFQNKVCGKLLVKRGVLVNSNLGADAKTFTNEGFTFVADTLNNETSFTNDGVLKYVGMKGNAIVNATNPSIIINDTPTPIFTYGGTYNGSVSGIFTDTTLTTSAGTFTPPNTFAPNATLLTGNQTLYAKISQNSCSEMLSIPFTYNYVPPAPEIDVKGNAVSITNGDTTPSAADSTDFGIVNVFAGINTNTFTIENSGTADLTIPANGITVTGTDAADFTLGGIPLPATVVTGDSTTFSITFNPSTAGAKSATVSIANNDIDESPYTFAISGSANDDCLVAATATDLMTWTGAKNTTWNDACNWMPFGVPTATNPVTIPSGTSNSPTLSVATAIAKSVEVQNGATFTIATTGALTINNSSTFAFGTSTPRTSAFYNEGTVDNNGSIILGNLSTVGEYGLWNNSTFNNNAGASVHIDNCTLAGLNKDAGVFTNNGMIAIGQKTSVGGYGIRSKAKLINLGGEIRIDRSTATGYSNRFNGNLRNEAKIVIGDSTSVGSTGLENSGVLNNNIGGEITINRANIWGIRTLTTLNNSGKITVGDESFTGRNAINAFGSLNNNAGGQISINNSTSFGLVLDSRDCRNSGVITIGESATQGLGMTTRADFDNMGCGKLIIKRGKLTVRSGSTFTNSGYTFVVDSLLNGDIFDNKGVLKFGGTSGNAIVNNQSSSIIVNDVTNPIFTYGGTYDGIINGIFTDSLVSNSAGTFTAPNSFVLSNSVISSNPKLFASITQNGCASPVAVPFTYCNVTIVAGAATNPSTCSGTDGSIAFTTNLTDGTYSLSFTTTGTASPQNVTVSGGAFTLSGLSAGSYSGFSVTNNGCTGSDATSKSLTDPLSPTLTAGAATNPTTCSGTNGSIQFTTNLADGTYSLSFTTTGTSSPQNVTVSSGAFTLSGLSAGNYSGFSVTNNGCTGSDASSKTLTNPPLPVITKQPENVSICQGNNGTISVEATGANLTYQWQELVSGTYQNITDGGIYSGATTASLSLSFPSSAKNGSQYQVIVSGGGCTIISSVATLSVDIGAEALAITNVTPILSGTVLQQAVAFTVALNQIGSNAKVTMQSGNNIQLLPGFETESGAVFTAQIQSPCGNTSIPSTSEIYKDLPKEIIK